MARKKKDINTEVKDTLPRKQVEQPQAKAAPKPKSAPLPLVRLNVFISASGLRFDQIAGFKAYATVKKLGPMTIPDWKLALDAFMKRPVN